MHWLAEVSYPRIDPIIVSFGAVKVRWYGVSYVLAFVGAYFVLVHLAKRKRWPVEPAKVADVLFWGILGVFIGGRLGYIFFYDEFDPSRWYRVWEGGMSFHGGLLGVIIAYCAYSYRTKAPLGSLFDGLTLATPIGIFCVRMANFVNAELFGRVWGGPWAMRFPNYERSCVVVDSKQQCGPEFWEQAGKPMLPDLRHPSQIYEALGEGLLLFFILRWLMLKKGIGGGRIAGFFLIGYGAVRFFIEFTREPDPQLGFVTLGVFTRGQELCFLMMLAGAIVLALCAFKKKSKPAGAAE